MKTYQVPSPPSLMMNTNNRTIDQIATETSKKWRRLPVTAFDRMILFIMGASVLAFAGGAAVILSLFPDNGNRGNFERDLVKDFSPKGCRLIPE